jgi:hypothetical protein
LKKKSKVSSRWIKIGTLLALAVIGGAAVLLLSRWPFTRDIVVRALQKKFSSTVEVKAFHGTYFPPGCVAEGVTFRRKQRSRRPADRHHRKAHNPGRLLGVFQES